MIYILEDDANIRELVVYTLNQTGLSAKGFGRSKEFWSAMEKALPRLVLLDIMLPDEDGLSVLKKLRMAPKTALLPVIMLTAKGTEYDKVVGLDLGADDYLPKPFGMMELVARINGLLRRTQGEQKKQEQYEWKGLLLNVPRHQVTAHGIPVALTLKEFDVLVMLLQHPGVVLTRDQIMSAVWEYDFDGESRTVDVHIRTLRNKLGSCGDLVETVRGVGYRIGGAE